jgi:hypothetical protein
VEDELDELDELGELEDATPRWVALLTTLGLALIAVVAAQVVASIIEGFLIKSPTEPRGVPTDLLHRLGFPFGSLGPTAMLLLVVALALICIPLLLDHENTPLLERLASAALVTVILLAVVVAIGSLLAVRYSLHEYTAQGQDPPSFIRVGFASFLLGTLGTAAAALFGSLAAISVRARRRRGLP